MFHKPADVRDYITAGNATITLESLTSGVHFTYRIRQATDRNTGTPVGRWFVSLLTGHDNEHDYSYIGLLDAANNGELNFRLTAKSHAGEDSPSVLGFRYMWRHICADHMPPKMAIRHEGKCGRCNRKLTVPESLERGIGPECAGIMGKKLAA